MPVEKTRTCVVDPRKEASLVSEAGRAVDAAARRQDGCRDHFCQGYYINDNNDIIITIIIIIIMYDIILYYITLYYIILYYTILYYILYYMYVCVYIYIYIYIYT